MRPLPHITWLRAFEAAARHSSFAAAAEELNLTSAAVSQQIRLLEQHLDIKLFKRLPKGVELTDIGQAYALPIRKSFHEMQSATDGLFTAKRRSTLRVRASISFAALVLSPRLQEFRAQNPDIDIDLSTTVWSDRMGDTALDLDIRYGNGNWPEQNIWHLGGGPAIMICHPDHAAQFGANLSIQAMAGQDVVQVTGSETDWRRLSDHFGLDLPEPSTRIKADSSLIALQIVAGGQGAALISRDFARSYLERGQLVAPFDHALPMAQSFYLIARDDSKNRREINHFRHWLTSTLTK